MKDSKDLPVSGTVLGMLGLWPIHHGNRPSVLVGGVLIITQYIKQYFTLVNYG